MGKRAMSLKDACDLVPDDLPDGAYWAMAHEIAGADYGMAFDELEADGILYPCPICSKNFKSDDAMRQHRRMKHRKLVARPQT